MGDADVDEVANQAPPPSLPTGSASETASETAYLSAALPHAAASSWQQLLVEHRVSLRCSLAGLAVWAISIAPLTLDAQANAPLRLAATLCLTPALAGAWQLQSNPRLARHLGVTLFTGLAVACWAMASVQGILGKFDQFQAGLGALAWAVFATSWTHPWSVPDSQLGLAPEGETLNLKPRRPPRRATLFIVAFGTLCGLGCLAAAATITGGTRAVLAQVIATAAAIAFISTSARLAALGGTTASKEGRSRRRKKQAPGLFRAWVPVLVAAILMALLQASRFASTAG